MTSIAQARDRDRIAPVYLVEIQLKNFGPVLYFSTRNITAGGQIYEDYLFSISGISDEVGRKDSAFLNADIGIEFRNERFRSYAYLIEIDDTYPFVGAAVTIKETWLDDNGIPSDVDTVFVGVLDEPEGIDLSRFSCRVSTTLHAKARLWSQPVIDTTDFPNAYEDLGKYQQIVYGSGVLMPAHRVDWGAKTTLKADVPATGNLELSDASRFPSSGSVYVDDEQVSYSGRTGNTLTGCTRGYGGTIATSHSAGATVWQVRTNYDSLLARHTGISVGDIFAEINGELLRVTSGVSKVESGGRTLLRASGQIRVQKVKDSTNVADTIAVNDTIGVSDTIGVNDGITVGDNIGFSSASTMITRFPTGGQSAARDGNESTYYTFNGVQDMTYPATSFGTIVEQYHYVTVNNTSGSQNTITINGTGYTLPANSGKVTLRHVEVNTAWDRYTRLSTVLAQQVYEAWKEVLYYPDLTKSGAAYRGGAASKTGAASKSGAATKSGSAAKTGGIYATHTVDRFHAVVTATYSRCDQVISDFLQTWLGYTAAEIDSPSFSAAGAWYASNSYAFGFVLDRQISPVDFLQQLAFECRSTLKFIRGKWYLDVVPDAAPASVRTISKDELAGEFSKFSFSHTPVSEIGNELVSRFKENYSAMGSESDWLGTSKASDAASKAKFGTYPQEFDFECIRSQAMADSVLAHILKQRKAPLLTVEFPVFYEHFDLLVGQTFDIVNDFYNGRKFFIEQSERPDQATARIRAVEWWI